MEKGDILDVVLLCTINVVFMIAGIFLNSVVIISLWRSRQLRKKLCYFMVLVLCCFDLAVVSIIHPLVVTSTIHLPIEETQKLRENMRVFCTYILTGFSMNALFTLTIERFLALARPFFHQAFVTKRKIVSYLILSSITLIGKSSVIFIKGKTVMIVNTPTAIWVLFMLFFSTYANYKMFVIAKSKKVDRKKVANIEKVKKENWKKRILNHKSVSTCSLAVGCYLFCLCPYMVYSALRLASGALSYEKQVLLFSLWLSTFVSINSTLNCVIFFWRNSILRREGMKIIDAFKRP